MRASLLKAASLTALLAVAIAASASAAPFDQQEWLAYVKTTATTQNDVFASRVDLTSESQITAAPGYEDVVSVSPDGKHVLIEQEFNLKYRLVTADVDGANFRVISQSTDTPRISTDAWSPDGQRIAFFDELTHEIVIARADGTMRRIVAGDAAVPAWGPTGDIAYGTGSELVVLDSRGVERWRRNSATEPTSWTPDGTKIAVLSDGAIRSTKLWLVPGDGSPLPRGTRPLFDAETQLSVGSSIASYPNIAPYSGRVVFTAQDAAAGDEKLAILTPGGAATFVPQDRFGGGLPTWGSSPIF